MDRQYSEIRTDFCFSTGWRLTGPGRKAGPREETLHLCRSLVEKKTQGLPHHFCWRRVFVQGACATNFPANATVIVSQKEMPYES